MQVRRAWSSNQPHPHASRLWFAGRSLDGVPHASAFQDTIRKVEIPELTYRYFKETGTTEGKALDGGLVAESSAVWRQCPFAVLFSGLWQPLTILDSHLLSIYYLATVL